MEFRNIGICAFTVLLVTACGGPSKTDVENALNDGLVLHKELGQSTHEVDVCPIDRDGFKDLPNRTIGAMCLLAHSEYKIDSVSNCMDKGDDKYACHFAGAMVSERYGTVETDADGIFEKTPSGWVAH